MTDQDGPREDQTGEPQWAENPGQAVPASLRYWELDPEGWSEDDLKGEEQEWWLAYDIHWGRRLVGVLPYSTDGDPYISASEMMAGRPETPREDTDYQDAIAAVLAAAWYDDALSPEELVSAALASAIKVREDADTVALRRSRI